MEFMPKNPKIKIREVTKKLNSKDFKAVKSDEDMKIDAEKRKENMTATPEEVAEEMKVPLADRVTPYHNLTYEEQLEKKREQLTSVLQGFSKALDSDVNSKREDVYPSWYIKDNLDLKQPCELSHIIECDEEYRNQYRNKVEFTIGRRYQDNAVCVGFNTGNLSKGITFVDYPDEIKTHSNESVWVAKQVQQLVIESGIEPYDKRINSGYWRIVLFRESKITKQALISIVVSKGYLKDDDER